VAMAISRPFLLVLLGAVLLGATALAVSNARTTADNDTAPALVQTDGATTSTGTTSTSGPADTLRNAFNLSDVHSGRFQANLYLVDAKTKARFSVAGAFDTAGDTAIPRFRVRASMFLNGARASGGFVSLGDRAYFARGDTGWRVPAALWGPLVDRAGAGGQQQKLPIDVHPETWVRDAKSEGSARIAGVETEHVSARIDVKAVANDVARAVGGTVNEREIERGVKRAKLEVWVGKEDHIVRQLQVVLAGQRKEGLELDARLTGVNKPQQIEAPAHVRRGAPGGTFGVLAQVVASGIGGVTGAQTSSLRVLTSPNPGRAARAVRDHRKVVIVFRNPRGLDDRAMTPVMRSVDRRTQALVLSDDVDAVERYGKLVEDLGVSQTPSIVIIDRTGKAQLLEGYVDANTLTQAVADAR
jgi:hypothetical protein